MDGSGETKKPPADDADLEVPAEPGVPERQARLEADKELVRQLTLHGFEGPIWQAFARALAEYGIQVIKAWVATGEIFRQCQKKGRGGLQPTARARDQDDITELAIETVALAINAFRDQVLAPQKWDPSQGACLKTFFIGQCIYQFPNVYRRWLREAGVPDPSPDDVRSTNAPQASAITLVVLREELSALQFDSTRKVRAMTEMGYSSAEIAEIIGVTKSSLDSKIYRDRRRKERKP